MSSSLLGRAAEAMSPIGPKRCAIALAAVVLLLLALLALPRGCAGGTAEDAGDAAAGGGDRGRQGGGLPAAGETAGEPREDVLRAVLGDDLADGLLQAAEADGDAAWIAAHPDALSVDGAAVQRKLLKLAAQEPGARVFVRAFSERYPARSGEPCDAPGSGAVPRLYQWDQRWGYTVYSSTAFALTGCCPTALSMVYQGLTGKADLSPYDMSLRARQGGYETAYDGTDQAFLVAEAASLGLSCQQISVDADALRGALRSGQIVICNVGPGDFTENGHFVVLVSVDDSDQVTLNDPYSAERSDRTWDVDDLLSQTKGLYAYELA